MKTISTLPTLPGFDPHTRDCVLYWSDAETRARLLAERWSPVCDEDDEELADLHVRLAYDGLADAVDSGLLVHDDRRDVYHVTSKGRAALGQR